MPDISKITLPSGTTYNIKDKVARDAIEALGNYTVYLGVTTTPLVDGVTTSPDVVIAGETKTATTGCIVTYGQEEFIYNGTTWQAFGDLGSLGDLAYKDDASTSYTPGGSVSSTFTGSSSNVTVTATANASGNYQPSGSISGTTFTGASMTSTGSFTPEGSVSLTNSNTTATVTTAASGTTTYQPSGSVTAPTISVKTAGGTTTVKNPTKVTVAKTVVAAAPGATAPSNNLTYYSVSNETLSLYQLGYTTGDSITTSDVTVKTSDAAYEATTPSFTGTAVRLVTGNISVPTSASFTGDAGDVTVSGTTTGSVSNGTFTGNKVQLAGTVTPSGSVSSSFSGTEATITVS